jgi:hypothetical protein
MVSALFDIENYLSGSLLIAVFVLCSMGGLIAIRRWFDLEQLRPYHDVAGNMFAVGGTLYAVLLGLVVVDAMGTFQTARFTVEKEADALANVFLLAEQLPAEKSTLIQSLCGSYAAEVVDHEWPMMDQGKIHKEALRLSLRLMREVSDFEPTSENQKAIYPVLLQQVLDQRDERRMRTSIALHGLPAIEWLVLCVGAVITIVFTYFFRLESYRAQLAMTGMVSLLIALNLYLVALFGTPFSGDLRVHPDPFKADLKVFGDLNDIDNNIGQPNSKSKL